MGLYGPTVSAALTRMVMPSCAKVLAATRRRRADIIGCIVHQFCRRVGEQCHNTALIDFQQPLALLTARQYAGSMPRESRRSRKALAVRRESSWREFC